MRDFGGSGPKAVRNRSRESIEAERRGYRKVARTPPGKRAETITIVKKLLESMGEESVVLPRFAPSEPKKLLTELSNEFPREMWKVAACLLGLPIDARAYSIKDWLSGAEHLWQSDQWPAENRFERGSECVTAPLVSG